MNVSVRLESCKDLDRWIESCSVHAFTFGIAHFLSGTVASEGSILGHYKRVTFGKCEKSTGKEPGNNFRDAVINKLFLP
jgi:hypothetical protein